MRTPPSLASIEAAFPAKTIGSDEIFGVPPESIRFRQHFGNLAWPNVKSKHYLRDHDAFYMMEYDSLRFFFAGFLCVSIEQPDSNTADAIVRFGQSKEFCEFCEWFDETQLKVVFETIDWLTAEPYYGEDDKERVARNREIILEKRK